MSGTAAPDPRAAVLRPYLSQPSTSAPLALYNQTRDRFTAGALAVVDAADRAAGVIRVRTDEQVEKLARVIFAACYPDDPFHRSQFDQQNQPRQELHRRQARAVLEALVTP